MHKGMFPADHVPLGPPVLPPGVGRLRYKHIAETLGLRRFVAYPEDLQLVQTFQVEDDARLLGIDLQALTVLAPSRKTAGLNRAYRAVLKLQQRGKGIVYVHLAHRAVVPGPVLNERARHTRNALHLAHQVTAKIDDMRPQVSQRAAARRRLLQPPDHRQIVVRHHPLLQIHCAEVVDLPQQTGINQLANLTDRRHEAIVEGHHVLHIRLLHSLQHALGLIRCTRQRLLAQNVLAPLSRQNTRIRVRVIRPAVVEELNVIVVQHRSPVRVIALVAVTPRGLRHGILVSSRNTHQPRHCRRRIHHMRNVQHRMAVGLAHKGVTQHPHTDLRGVAFGTRSGHRSESGSFTHRSVPLLFSEFWRQLSTAFRRPASWRAAG